MSMVFQHLADAMELAKRLAKRTDADQVVWRVVPDPTSDRHDRFVVVEFGRHAHFTCQARPVVCCTPDGREISG